MKRALTTAVTQVEFIIMLEDTLSLPHASPLHFILFIFNFFLDGHCIITILRIDPCTFQTRPIYCEHSQPPNYSFEIE